MDKKSLRSRYNFVERSLLGRKIEDKETPVSKRGSREALLECIGIWAFEPGELDELLIEIEHGRLMGPEEIG